MITRETDAVGLSTDTRAAAEPNKPIEADAKRRRGSSACRYATTKEEP